MDGFCTPSRKRRRKATKLLDEMVQMTPSPPLVKKRFDPLPSMSASKDTLSTMSSGLDGCTMVSTLTVSATPTSTGSRGERSV